MDKHTTVCTLPTCRFTACHCYVGVFPPPCLQQRRHKAAITGIRKRLLNQKAQMLATIRVLRLPPRCSHTARLNLESPTPPTNEVYSWCSVCYRRPRCNWFHKGSRPCRKLEMLQYASSTFYESRAKLLLYLCNSGDSVFHQLNPKLSNIGVCVHLL